MDLVGLIVFLIITGMALAVGIILLHEHEENNKILKKVKAKYLEDKDE